MQSGSERPLLFPCEGEQLLGIVHDARGSTGVLMIAGGPQVRVGSHRLYVQQARRMARAGAPVFRFDVRGMGDSSGRFPGFELLMPDIRDALAAFQAACPWVRRFVLWGLCDGASAALLYQQDCADRRVAGLCLLNPWVRTPSSQARTQVRHYYRDRLRQMEFWKKLVGGRVGATALLQGMSALRAVLKPGVEAHAPTAFPTRMAEAWHGFSGPILLVLSGLDYTAKEFIESTRNEPAWSSALDRHDVKRLDLASADHTFSTPGSQQLLGDATEAWLRDHVLQVGLSSRALAP